MRTRPGFATLGLVLGAVLLVGALPVLAEDGHGEALGGLNIPDVELYDHDGKAVRFRSDLVDGKVVVMNFIFTTCTTICPPMGASFGKLQRELGERAGRDVHLISLSIDPVIDTPRRLKAWRAKFGAEEGWTLVTGKKPEIDKLLKALEVFTPLFTDHAPIVLVGNGATNEWTRAYGLAPPEDVLRLAERAAARRADSTHHAEETGK